MQELLYPNKEILQKEFLINYGQQFLSLNNLKVGDKIELEFPYQQLSSAYNSRILSPYTFKKICKGVLMINEDGCLYAESINELDFYESILNDKVRIKKIQYILKKKKSIVKFGTGFIHFH